MADKIYYYIDTATLPETFPTHEHPPHFWEALGRTIATFGFLEEMLGKAIFAFTVTRKYPAHDAERAYQAWLLKIEKALTDPLVNLAETYRKSVLDHPECDLQNVDDLIEKIKRYSKIRNALCHGSWRPPDKRGKSTILFVNKQKERFTTPMDVQFLQRVQKNTMLIACSVINSVTHMGWQFPGSASPGEQLWDTDKK
ncbi:MAG TPA: hypothetical protein VE028_05695 [Nitratidesulfovibrio sp.]|nr:hypothetical protein [Nitratidesulfovibrio sp.]